MTALSNANPELRRYWSSLGGKAHAAKLTPEQRQAISKAAKARVARMSPEQIREFNSKSSRAYWTRMTAEERSEAVRARVQVRSPEVRRNSARKAAEHRWGQPAYAAHQKDADRVYAFLEEHISAKHYAPTVKELSRALGYDPWFTSRMLRILQRIGRIQRHPWPVRITLTSPAPVSAGGVVADWPQCCCRSFRARAQGVVQSMYRMRKPNRGWQNTLRAPSDSSA
jgi:hypothetical protein